MGMFSYVVARDYGFAPNPFGGFCTLATCKPEIRRLAQIGDWIVGTGSATRERDGHLVYAMKVAEAISFNEYWFDPRFQAKKPTLTASKKLAFGDNIYCRDGQAWKQEDSHHSHADGSPNQANITNDCQVNRVLVGTEFAYWGGQGPKIPASLRAFNGHDLCIGRGYKRHFPLEMEIRFVAWFNSFSEHQGYLGKPLDWIRTP